MRIILPCSGLGILHSFENRRILQIKRLLVQVIALLTHLLDGSVSNGESRVVVFSDEGAITDTLPHRDQDAEHTIILISGHVVVTKKRLHALRRFLGVVEGNGGQEMVAHVGRRDLMPGEIIEPAVITINSR